MRGVQVVGHRGRDARHALLGKRASFTGTQWAADHGCGRGAQTALLPEPVLIVRPGHGLMREGGSAPASMGLQGCSLCLSWGEHGPVRVLCLSVCPGARAGPVRVLCLSWGKRGPHEGILSVHLS